MNFHNKVWVFGKQTIKHYARLSKPFEYSDFIIKNKNLKLIPNDYEIATYFLHLCSDEIFYIDDVLYVYDNDEWRVDNKSQIIKTKIRSYIDKVVQQDLNKLFDEGDNNADRKKELISTSVYLHDYNKISKVSKYVIDLLKARNDDIIFDLGEEQKFNIHYQNGVYNIKDKSFRARTKHDYITFKLDYDYVEILEDDDIYKNVELCGAGNFGQAR